MEVWTLLFAGIGALGTVTGMYKTVTQGVGAWRWDYQLHEFPAGKRLAVLVGQRIGGGGAYDIEVRVAQGMSLLPDKGAGRAHVESGETVKWRFDVPEDVADPFVQVRWRNGVQRWRPMRSKRFSR